MLPRKFRGLAVAVVVLVAACPAWSEKGDLPASISPALSANQIVDQMQLHNQQRNSELKHYQSTRQYSVTYKGFDTTVAAAMQVEVNYDASAGKTLRIVSQTGSKFLCDKVLKRAVDSEREAAQDKGSTALTTANYRFQLVGSESLNGRRAYILSVEPIADSKFLYRGKVWVDEEDFAVAKVEAEPAKNPSIWISRTEINYTNAKTGNFWLPQENRSKTKVRIGGTAEFTIDYGAYQVVPQPATAPPTLASAR